MSSPKNDKSIELFKHVDGKVDKARDEMFKVKEVEIQLKDMLVQLQKRIDFGVAKTGQENKTALNEQSLILRDIHHRLELNDKWKDDFKSYTDGRFTGMEKSFKDMMEPVSNTIRNLNRMMIFSILGTITVTGFLFSFKYIMRIIGNFLGT